MVVTGKEDKIQSLKSRQVEKKFQIEQYKQKTKKRLFIFSLTFSLITLYFLDDSYKVFGNIETYLIIFGSILFGVLISYNLIIFLLIRKRRKEIKRINGRIYRLMKLKKNEQKK